MSPDAEFTCLINRRLDRRPFGTRLATRRCTGGEQNNTGWLTPLRPVTSSDATAAALFTLSLPIPFDSPVILANRLEPISQHYRTDNFQPTSGCSMRRIGASRTASKRRIIQSHYDEDTTDEETIHDTRTTVDTREPGVRLETQSRSCDRE